jgi:hypothetical protein
MRVEDLLTDPFDVVPKGTNTHQIDSRRRDRLFDCLGQIPFMFWMIAFQ